MRLVGFRWNAVQTARVVATAKSRDDGRAAHPEVVGDMGAGCVEPTGPARREHWHATVDGQPAPLLRGNMIMRAVPVGAGSHVVEFRHSPPHGLFHVSLSALAAAALLLVALVVPRRPSPLSSPR